MNLGLRAILLLVAIILFVIAVFSDVHWPDFIALGLACAAGAFVVDDLGVANRIGTRTGDRT